MKAYKHLVETCINNNCTISIYDGEVWEIKRSSSYKAIIDCIESVEEAQLNIRDKEGNAIGRAIVSAFGLADDETVIDHTDNGFFAAWYEQYETKV